MCHFIEVFFFSVQNLRGSARVTTGLTVTFLDKAFLAQPALGRILVVPNFSHLGITEATLQLGTLMLHIYLFNFRAFPRHNPVSELCSFWYSLSVVRSYRNRCGTFLILSSQLSFSQVNSSQNGETSKILTKDMGDN